MNKKAFGQGIKELRESKNITQEELAERLCVTQQTVSSWERGGSYPDIEMVERICSVLDIQEQEMFEQGRLIAAREENGNGVRKAIGIMIALLVVGLVIALVALNTGKKDKKSIIATNRDAEEVVKPTEVVTPAITEELVSESERPTASPSIKLSPTPFNTEPVAPSVTPAEEVITPTPTSEPKPTETPTKIPTKALTPTNAPLPEKAYYDFDARYIRADSLDALFRPSTASVISSSTELDAFMDRAVDNPTGLAPNHGLATEFSKYDANWFSSGHKLLAIIIGEHSGSIRHKVTRVTKNTVSIECLIPEIGTDDMASWLVLIEPEVDWQGEGEIKVEFINVRESNG